MPGTTPSPQATPLPPGTILGIPEKIPGAAMAEMSQAEWTAQRQHCLSVIAEVNRRHHLSEAQLRALPILRHSEVLECLDLQTEFRTPDVSPGPPGGLINPAMPPQSPSLPAPNPPQVSPQSELPVSESLVATAAAVQVLVTTQSAQATPLPPGTPLGIPVTIPPNWVADGWDQAEWTAQRQHCVSILAEVSRRHYLGAAQLRVLLILAHSEVLECLDLLSGFAAMRASHYSVRLAIFSQDAPMLSS